MGSARYIGRVGALAVALGIGTAVAGSPGVALAEPSDSGSSDSSSSSSRESPSVSSSTTSASESSTATGMSSPESSVAANDSATHASTSAATVDAVESGDDLSTESDEASESIVEIAESGEAIDVIDEPEPIAPDEPQVLGVADEPLVSGDREADVSSAGSDHTAPVAEAAVVAEGLAVHTAEVSSVEQPGEMSVVDSTVQAESVVMRSADEVPNPMPPSVAEDSSSAAVPHSVTTAQSAPETPPNVVSGAVSGLLAWVGLGPSAGSTPVAPIQSPASLVALAFVRRELQQAASQQSPTLASAAVQTSQTDPGLLGGTLHLLFNNTPTINYDPADNTQDPQGVVSGDLNAADADGDALLYTLTQAPQHGTVVLQPDGSFTYTPEPDFAHTGGTDSFDVTVSDDTYVHLLHLGGGHLTSASIDVTVNPVNQSPVVGDPAFTVVNVDPDTGVVTGAVNVTDADADPLTYSVIGEPEGVAVDQATGDWTYTPSLQDRLRATDINATPDDQQVSFTITATDGTASTGVLVTAPITPLAISTIDVGGTPAGVAFSPNGSHAYVTNPQDATVLVIDTDTNQIVATINNVGNSPLGVATTTDGARVYITNLVDGTVMVIDTATNTVVGDPIPVGSFPTGVAVTPNGSQVYVVNTQDGTVSVIDTANNEVTDTIDVGEAPADVVVSLDGTRAYVVSTGSGTVSAIDTATNTVTDTIPVGEFSSGVAISPDGRYVYVSNNGPDTVSVIDTTTNEVVGDPIPVGVDPFGMAVSPDGRYVYVISAGSETISVIDTATETVVSNIGMSAGRVALSPDGTRVYVTNTEDGTVSVISTLVQDTAPAVTVPPAGRITDTVSAPSAT